MRSKSSRKGLSCDRSKEDFSGDNRELCLKAGGALNNGRGRPAPSLYFLTAFAAQRRGRAPYTLARSLIAHSSHSLALPANPSPASPGPREAVRRRNFHTPRILSGFECLNSRTCHQQSTEHQLCRQTVPNYHTATCVPVQFCPDNLRSRALRSTRPRNYRTHNRFIQQQLPSLQYFKRTAKHTCPLPLHVVI